MTEILAGNWDHGARVRLIEPNVTGAAGTVYELRDVFDMSVSFNEQGEPGSLDLWTYKDSAGAAQLQGDHELQVDLWDPRQEEYVALEDGRFIVDTYEEDRVDETNTIHYKCPSVLWLLDKVRIYRAPGDYGLNNAYDRALERLREAERPYERALERFEELADYIRRRHGLSGNNYAYHGVFWLSQRYRIPHGSLASNASLNGRLYFYSSYARTWRALTMSSWTESKQALMERGVELANARRVYNAAREVFDKAERAARETSRDGRRYFYNSSPGRTVTRLWGEGIVRDRDRGFDAPSRILKGRNRTFTNALTSTGDPWPSGTRTSHDFPLGSSLLRVLLDFQERGLADFKVRGGSVDLVPAGGFEVDQSDRVVLKMGRDLTSAPERGSRMHHFSEAVVVGGDGYSRSVLYAGGSHAETPWGYWEDSISEPASDSLQTARTLTRPARERARHRHKTEATMGVVLHPASPIPMVDYQPGHWITVEDHDSNASRRKVTQIVLRWSPDEPMSAVITLDDRFHRQATNFSRTLSKTLGGVDHLQSHIPRNPALEPPVSSEAPWFAPPLTNIQTSLRFDPLSGLPTVVVRASFADPGLPEPEDPEDYDKGALPDGETDPADDGFTPDPDDEDPPG